MGNGKREHENKNKNLTWTLALLALEREIIKRGKRGLLEKRDENSIEAVRNASGDQGENERQLKKGKQKHMLNFFHKICN